MRCAAKRLPRRIHRSKSYAVGIGTSLSDTIDKDAATLRNRAAIGDDLLAVASGIRGRKRTGDSRLLPRARETSLHDAPHGAHERRAVAASCRAEMPVSAFLRQQRSERAVRAFSKNCAEHVCFSPQPLGCAGANRGAPSRLVCALAAEARASCRSPLTTSLTSNSRYRSRRSRLPAALTAILSGFEEITYGS